MLREVASLRMLARLVLVVSVGGVVPPSQPHVGSAAIDTARLAASSKSRVDHLPALSRLHVRDGGRLEGSRKSLYGSAALPEASPAAVVVGLPPGTNSGFAHVPSSAERSSHRLRGPPSRI